MRKPSKLLSLLLALAMIIAIVPVSNITVSAASYTNDWQRWSQGASDDSNIRAYGCWVVAQARLIKMLGINNSSTFNPDVYLKWEQSAGHINSNYYQINGDTAPVDYAKSLGKNLTYCGTYYSSSDVWKCINNGDYGIICVSTTASPTGSHWMLLDNDRSKSTGVICCYDSWSGYSVSRSVTLSEMSYTFYSIYTYRYNPHTHSYGSWQTVTAATCTSAGSSKRVCSCGDTQTRTDAALGHSWDSGVIEAAADCTSAGVKKYTCTRCKTTKTEAISASGHTLIEDKEIPATCTETGLTKGSHCSVCNAIVTKQQIIPALGHKENIESINKTCTTVTANYKCTVCGATRTETKEGGIYSDWSEDKPSVENYKEKTVYSFRDKSTTYKDGTNTLDGWDYNGNSEPIYGSWTNGGWVKSKPTETDVLKITDTKTVKDSEAHGYILYYYYYPNSSAIFRFKDYGGNSGLYYLEVSSLSELTKSTDGPWYDGDARYDGYWNGTGVTWFFAVNDSSKYPKSAVTHTEWYYQTRTKTTRYYFDKWSDWSAWSDDVVLATDKKEVKTKTLYSYEILPTGHTLSDDWQSDSTGHWHICTECGEKVDAAKHIFDNDKDTNCNVCGYVRIVKPEVSDTDTQVTVNSVKAKPGDEVKVIVSLKNAPNITSMTASDIVYDKDALTLKSAEWLSANPAMNSWNPNTQKGVIGYGNAIDLNGETLELTFIVSDTATEDDYSISLTYRMTIDGEIVDVPVIPGTITVKNYVSGDTNGDDRVTDQDAIYLLFHVYFEDEYPVNQPCDFNKDGNVTDQDAIYLLFHVYFEEEYPIG